MHKDSNTTLDEKSQSLLKLNELIKFKEEQLASLDGGAYEREEKKKINEAFNNILKHIDNVPMDPNERNKLRNKIEIEIKRNK